MSLRPNRCTATAGALAAILSAVPLASASSPTSCAPEVGTSHRIARVIDGETVQLDDGRDVRLMGALAPRPDWMTTDVETWPPAQDARRALEALTLNRTAVLHFEGRRRDRYGRVLAQLEIRRDGEPSVWVQQHMIENGQARAYALPGNTGCLSALWAAETAARRGRKGHWRGELFRVITAEEVSELLRLAGRFVVVEGRVAAVARTRRLTYINFGPAWRDDFTVSLPNTAVDRSENGETRAEGLEGQTLRVRGWIERRNGPMLELSSLDEIEVIGGAVPAHQAEHAETPDKKTPR